MKLGTIDTGDDEFEEYILKQMIMGIVDDLQAGEGFVETEDDKKRIKHSCENMLKMFMSESKYEEWGSKYDDVSDWRSFKGPE